MDRDWLTTSLARLISKIRRRDFPKKSNVVFCSTANNGWMREQYSLLYIQQSWIGIFEIPIYKLKNAQKGVFNNSAKD